MNIKDIAHKSGVSMATVSRFLDPEKSHLVHSETQNKVRRVIAQCHYIPNRSARALKKNKSETIGMVTPFSTDVVKSPYFTNLIAGIIEGLRPTKYDLKWIMIRNEDGPNCDLRQLLSKYSVDGIIFLSWRLLPRLVEEIARHRHLPAVLINDYDPGVKCSIVFIDNQAGVKEAFDHLYSKGYRRIGMVRGPEDISLDSRKRYETFCRCRRARGLGKGASY